MQGPNSSITAKYAYISSGRLVHQKCKRYINGVTYRQAYLLAFKCRTRTPDRLTRRNNKKPSCRQDSRPYCPKLQGSRDLGHAHFQGKFLCARSVFPIQSCIPNLKSLAQVVFEKLRFKRIGGHEFDLSRSRDVIGHVTIRQPTCHFLLVVLWNHASISNGFRDI